MKQPSSAPTRRLLACRILYLTFAPTPGLVSLRSLTYLGPGEAPSLRRPGDGSTVCGSFIDIWWWAGWC
jgi:hypothetical protein